MGRKGRQGNTTPQKTNMNSIEDLVENERNESPVADFSRVMASIYHELKE
jgi:hypothetical protein